MMALPCNLLVLVPLWEHEKEIVCCVDVDGAKKKI